MSWGVMAVGSTGGSSSEVSPIAKPDRLAMLMDGDCTMGGLGIVPVPGTVADSEGEGRAILGSKSVLGSPRHVATGVEPGSSPLPVLLSVDFRALNTGGGGRPSHPRARN